MTENRKTFHVFFITAIAILTIFKWNDLHLAYFWDELGVYSRAVGFQVRNGVSLMPASLPPDLSRGHPLLFTCINAFVAKVFGLHVFVIHFFCFFISTLLLLAVYLKISKYFNPVTGFLSAVVLAIQPLFLAQSGLVLPEITLALFVFMSICSYYENKFVLFAFFSSLAILTKEAAIVLPVTVLGYSIVKWGLLKAKPQGLKISALSLTLAPYWIFGFFLLIQKRQNGWFFFPQHIDSVAFSFETFLQQIQRFTTLIFLLQGRTFLVLILIVGFIFSLLRIQWTRHRIGSSFLLLLVLLSLAILGFNSMIDLYMERYSMLLLIAFSICVSAALTGIPVNRFFLVVITALLVFISGCHLDDTLFHYDADLGYRKDVKVLQQSVDYIAEHIKPGEKALSNFPGGFALYPDGGYLRDRKIDYLANDLDSSNYFLLICNPGTPFQVDTANSVTALVKTFNEDYASTWIYYVKKKK